MKLENTGDLSCPITGKDLFVEVDESIIEHTLDGPTYYRTETNETRYERWPREFNIFRSVHFGNNQGLEPLSYWRLRNDSKWEEVKYHNELDEYFTLDVDPRLIEVLLENKKLKEKIRNFEVLDSMREGTLFPTVKKVHAKPIANDIIPVQPMSSPSSESILSTISCVYESTHLGKTYPIKVTAENLSEIQSEWDLEKYEQVEVHGSIKIGDEVHWWKTGGPLSTRAGECIIRNNEVIYKSLKIMS